MQLRSFPEFPDFLLHLPDDDIPTFAVIRDLWKAQRLADVDGDLVRPGEDSAGRAGFKGAAQMTGNDWDIAAGHQHAHARLETEVIAVARSCAFGKKQEDARLPHQPLAQLRKSFGRAFLPPQGNGIDETGGQADTTAL